MLTLNLKNQHIISIMIFLISFLFLTLLASHTYAFEKTVTRVNGDNRYDTSVEISKKTWDRSETVIISVGNQFPDALSGAPLAYSLNAPILLSFSDTLPYVVEKEIQRLGASKAIVLGGEQVISTKVIFKLKSMGLTVERLNGRDRYETSVAIANKINSSSDTVVIAYGGNFPDSLAIAAHASRKGYPILLTEKNNLPAKIRNVAKKFKHTIVVGGEQAVSTNVLNQLSDPMRISGADRYTTAAKIMETFYPGTQDTGYVASGTSFADALTGSILAAKENRPILLVEDKNVPTVVTELSDLKGINHFIIIGGKSVVTEQVESKLTFNIKALIETAKSLEGVPYAWGGTTTKGFDCSGFLNYVYSKSGVVLPRTTSDIWNHSTKVSKPAVGDVVFFETYKTGPSHAGIYLGNNEFIHASSSKGVTITRLDNSYFKPRFLGVKRVI